MTEAQVLSMSLSYWNTQAISFLQQGDYSGAIALFKRCSRALASQAHFPGPVHQPGHISNAIKSVVVVSDVFEHVNEGIFELFPRAFLMQFPVLEDYENSARVLLYNMALAHDIMACSLEAANEKLSAFACTTRAMHLYHWALRVGEDNSLVLGTKTLADVVALAAMNNLGRIMSHLNYFENTRTCLLLSLEIFHRVWHADDCPEMDNLPCGALAPFLYMDNFVLVAAPAA